MDDAAKDLVRRALDAELIDRDDRLAREAGIAQIDDGSALADLAARGES